MYCLRLTFIQGLRFHKQLLKSSISKPNIVLNRHNNNSIGGHNFLYSYFVYLMKIYNDKSRLMLKQRKFGLFFFYIFRLKFFSAICSQKLSFSGISGIILHGFVSKISIINFRWLVSKM